MFPVKAASSGQRGFSSSCSDRFRGLGQPFEPPHFAKMLHPVPKTRLRLGQFPTPIHSWEPPGIPTDLEMKIHIKRDDWSGMELGGNKVRKLEFLIAEALESGMDSVITIGGVQSNHARATAMASRLFGLTPHLILRTSKGLEREDPGLVGNLLPERLAGSHLHLVTKSEYASHGSQALLAMVEESLKMQGKAPYVIPVGGSNSLGTWGYILFVEELLEQTKAMATDFDHIVLATGSGGTAAGIALGLALAKSETKVDCFGVCDSPEYFYNMTRTISQGMGVELGSNGLPSPEDLLTVHQAKGRGYAINSDQELEVMASVARETGVVLDPVYSGKALYAFIETIKNDPESWRGKRVLFLHTGGMLGMFDKVPQMSTLMSNEDYPFEHLFQ